MRYICWRSRVERGLEFELGMRLQEKEGKRDWRGAWAIDRSKGGSLFAINEYTFANVC